MAATLESVTADRLGEIANAEAPTAAKLDAMLALLASYRSEKLLQSMLARYGR